jgi:HAE1 family hydrophobic/amphiphilic exporter-1
MWLTTLAIRRPITVLMLVVSLLVLGAISFGRLPLNFLPEAEFPYIGVQIPYPNGVPSQVEREITRPIEEILATLGGVKDIESYSDGDVAYVGVEFDWGRDVDVLRLEVKEKIDQIRPELPSDIQQILLFTFNTNDIPIVEGRISAKDRDLSESYGLLETRVVDRLARLAGVGRVYIDGVEPADLSVYLKLDRIKEHNVDVGRLFAQLRDSNFDLSVGHVEQDGLRYPIRSLASLSTIEDLRDLPIDDKGLKLSDIADVEYGTPVLPYGRFLNLEPAVAFVLQKSSDANTVDVVKRVKAELAEINRDPMLEGIEVLMFFDQGAQITNSIEGLLQAGVIGSILAIGVLYFFLRRLGTTLIIGLAIPISIVGTASYLYLSGRSLNILSMMGLMLGVGMLIDNAVVVLESIYRRMSLGDDPIEATLKGTKEVGRAVVSATLTSIVVFAPVVFGGTNELAIWLGEVGRTISVTLIFSLLVSLTVIPVLTTHWLKPGSATVAKNPTVEGWARRYGKILEWTAIRHPWITGVPIALGILVVTGAAIAITGFGPDVESDRGMRREYFQIMYEYTDNVNYHRSKETVETVQNLLWEKRADYGIEYLYSFYRDGYAMNRLYLQKHALSENDFKQLRKRLRDDLPELAGVKLRLGDDSGDAGAGAKSFSVTLYGEDSELLAGMSDEVKRRLSLFDDIQDLRTDIEQGADEIQVKVDSELAERYGITADEIAQVMGITFRGVQLPRVATERREVDLWVLLQPEDRQDIESLSSLVVSVQNDRDITLEQVAALEIAKGPARISRENQRTAVQVYGSYEGEEFDDMLRDIRIAMDALHLPPGYGWNFGSEIQDARQQQNDMAVNALLAIACVYMIMASLFESLVHPAVVMFCLPFAIFGVVWIMILTGSPMNIMAMIGVVILIGVIVNNGIVLVDHINHHRREGKSMDEAIVLGGRERFRPILMTATTTVLGLIPLAVSRSHVGGAENYPMARALIGGLLSGTFLTLVMLPTYYQLSHRILTRVRAIPAVVRRLAGRVLLRRRALDPAGAVGKV